MRKTVSLTIRNRAGALVFVAALLAAGALLLTVGFALLLGLAVVGGVVGTGIAAYRAIRGKNALPSNGGFAGGDRSRVAARTGLDPALEIAAPRSAVVRRADGVDTP